MRRVADGVIHPRWMVYGSPANEWLRLGQTKASHVMLAPLSALMTASVMSGWTSPSWVPQ